MLTLDGEQRTGGLTDGCMAVNAVAGIQSEKVFVVVSTDVGNAELVIGEIHAAAEQKMTLAVFLPPFEQHFFGLNPVVAEVRQQFSNRADGQFIERDKALNLFRG